MRYITTVFHLAIFFLRERAKSKCNWLVMSPVFVVSQSCMLLCSLFARTNTPGGKQAFTTRVHVLFLWLGFSMVSLWHMLSYEI